MKKKVATKGYFVNWLSASFGKPVVDTSKQTARGVIRRIKSDGFAELWEKARTGKIDTKMHARIFHRLERYVIVRPEEMNVPGFEFHPLRGSRPTRHSVHVNGPWCLTFELEEGDASTSHNITEEGQSWSMLPSVILVAARPIQALCCGRM